MCGIFGAIGKGFDLSIVRALAIANVERGRHSLGFMSPSKSGARVWKRAAHPYDALPKAQRFLTSAKSAWFLVGHTRWATRGAIIRRNAHPFTVGAYTGVHNGCIDAPQTFEVDSQYLFARLNETDGAYQRAWENIGGNWGAAWFDGKHLRLQAHDQQLAIAELNGVYYFSSDSRHLAACTGSVDCWDFSEGETWRFSSNGSGVEEPRFRAPERAKKPKKAVKSARETWWTREWDRDDYVAEPVGPTDAELEDFAWKNDLHGFTLDEIRSEYDQQQQTDPIDAWSEYTEDYL